MSRKKKIVDPLADVTMTEKQRLALVKSSLAHTERVNAQRVTYPDPTAKLSLDAIKALGFAGADRIFIVDDEDVQSFRGGKRRNKNRGSRGGGSQGGGNRGGGGGGKSLSDPEMVADEVERPLKDIPFASMTDVDLALGEQNFENLDPTKARFFKRAISAIVRRHHLMFCIEVSPDGLKQIADDNPDYTHHVSQANNRQQAVGFLVHKRLKVLKVTEYSNVAQVFNIPDLRSALRLDLQDTVTGIKFSVVVVHLKSMRGGEAQTSKVRRQQAVELVKSLGSGLALPLPAFGNLQIFPWFKNPKLGRSLTDHALCRITLRLDKVTCVNGELILIAGDWNLKLDTAKDLDPLYAAGWLLAWKNNSTATQITGPSRLDGFVGNGDNDKSCGGGNGGDPHGLYSNDPTADPEVDVTK